eukprot:COSAG02_NODE_3216_length_7160_cov_11.806260_5_plen_491_part_00
MAMQLAGGAIRRAFSDSRAAAAAAFAAAAQVALGGALTASEAQTGSSLTSTETAKQTKAILPDDKRVPNDMQQPGWHSNHYSVWHGDGTPATFEDVIASAAEADVVLMGEEHDDRVTHALQLDLLSGLHSRLSGTRQLALAMEMFETDVQPVIDDYLGGHIREKDFVMDARPWNNYAADYRPLVEFAKNHGLQVMASNAPRRYVSLLGRGGGQDSLAALGPASRALLPPLPIPEASDAYQQIFMGHMAPAMKQRDASQPSDSVWALAADGQSYEVEAIVAQREGPKGEEYLIKWRGYPEGDSSWHEPNILQGDFQQLLPRVASSVRDCPAISQGAESAAVSGRATTSADEGACPYIGFDHTKLTAMLEAQCLWDASMAWTLAKFHCQARPKGNTGKVQSAAGLVLHINGSFHSRGRRGIPERLVQYCASGDGPGARTGPRCLVVTCASSTDVGNFPAHLAAFASTGGTGDDFIILTDDAVSPSFEIEHPV